MGNAKMLVFEYTGPVYVFERMVVVNATYRTRAVSLRRAKSNIAFNVKKQLGKTADSKINLPGNFRIIKEDPVAEKENGIQMRMDI